MVFMLREGPLQRCMACGQIYKLVRLRNEHSPEMDYWKTSTIPLDIEEFGEADQWVQNSIIRLMPGQWENSLFEHRSNSVWSLMNPHDHDRMLVDPAYRLQKLKEMEDASQAFAWSMSALKELSDSQHKQAVLAATTTEYANMVEAEESIERIDRIFRRTTKFASRQFLDVENHERREKRMRETSNNRVTDSYTVYFGGLTEEEAQYRDYFQSDLELDADDEAYLEHEARFRITSQDHFQMKNFDFQELYTINPEQDAQGMLKRRLFEFKFRRANDTELNYDRRERRLFDRHIERFSQQGTKDLFLDLADAKNSNNTNDIHTAERALLKFFAREGSQQFLDYYETDKDEVTELVETLPDTDIAVFLSCYEDYARSANNVKGYQSVPKRKWNKGLGFWSNISAELQDYRGFVAPRVEKLQNQLNLLDAEIYTRDLRVEGESQTQLLD